MKRYVIALDQGTTSSRCIQMCIRDRLQPLPAKGERGGGTDMAQRFGQRTPPELYVQGGMRGCVRGIWGSFVGHGLNKKAGLSFTAIPGIAILPE